MNSKYLCGIIWITWNNEVNTKDIFSDNMYVIKNWTYL